MLLEITLGITDRTTITYYITFHKFSVPVKINPKSFYFEKFTLSLKSFIAGVSGDPDPALDANIATGPRFTI